MKDQHPIDEFFKEKLEGHESKPSVAAWEKIATEVQGDSKKNRSGLYLTRAAAVLLLGGLSALFYFNTNDGLGPNDPANVAVEETISETENSGTETTADEPEKKEEKEAKTEGTEKKEEVAPKKQRKVIPIMQQKGNRQPIVVDRGELNAEVLDVVDEKSLMDEEELKLTADLETEEPNQKPDFRVKMNLNPATASAFYNGGKEPHKEQEDLDLKDRLMAYATNQFDNLKAGKPLELPKREKKPQLEINLDKLF